MGFEGFLIDYIQGPDAVLAMLCDNAALHRTAYTSRSISEEQYSAVSRSPIQRWVSGGQRFQITTRREYNASSTSVNDLKKASVFVDQPANSEDKRQLDGSILNKQREIAELKENYDISVQESRDLKRQLDELKQMKDDIQAEQDRMRTAFHEWQQIPHKKVLKKEEYNRIQQAQADTSATVRAHKAASRRSHLDLTAHTIEYAVGSTLTWYRNIANISLEGCRTISSIPRVSHRGRDPPDRGQIGMQRSSGA